MTRAENKATRLIQIENILLAHPEGLTQAEIARRLGVDRSTIHRNLVDLPGHIYEEEDGRLKIDRSADLINVRLNLHEALAVHLASRLLATRMDRQNRHAAAALRKLGLAMERWAKRISAHVLQSADVMDDSAQRDDPAYLDVLEKLTEAWAGERKVHIWHQGEAGEKVLEYLLSPYFIEPYAVGQTTHVIGLAQMFREQGGLTPEKMRTFKIERIRRTEVTHESYTLPADFDPRNFLADAWGVWYTESEPVEVTLKFSPKVARRLQETRWHRSEQEEVQPDGSIIWQARIAEPKEMLPWVRGWGADVEVLEPEGLRKELEKEARRLARVYGIEKQEDIPAYFHLWAKAEKNQSPDVHPLIYHLLDVGSCALALWKGALSAQTRRTLAGWLGLDEEPAGQQIAFLAALHDLGKAAPGFQRKYEPRIPVLQKVGFIFPSAKDMNPSPPPHGILSTWALVNLLASETGLDRRIAAKVAAALGGHHGVWPTSDRFQFPALQPSDKGDETWNSARRQIFVALKGIYSPSDAVNLPNEFEPRHAFLTLLSGLVSVADWIGSMEKYFPFMDESMPPAEYAHKHAAPQAEMALTELGWVGWQAQGALKPFDVIFPKTPHPNEIQHATLELASQTALPALLILEAPTGIGKTEAALALADTWLQRERGSGLYIAMPTQATSNQMYERVIEFLRSCYPEQAINAHLIHGGALLAEEQPAPAGIAQDEDSAERGVKAESWFLPRKRTLLAPFGVGTVDQALMSVLQTRHFFVRLFGLGQKVVVFDEIHAYDTYMSELFQRLLHWLRTMGTSAILLSATLPEKTRRGLVAAWLGKDDGDGVALPPAEYPRLTLVSGGQVASVPLPAPPSRVLQLDWIETGPEQIAAHLAEKLRDGGCAAVICNRVQWAQDIYQALQDAHLVELENLILFHARYPFQWREDIEEKVLKKFGKDKKHPDQPNPNRPRRAVVVATQVIEQSLDLDFDYMVSDLAPVDLLLQRAGRLQRHPLNDAGRPARLSHPVMAIALPAEKDNLPDFGRDVWIYDEVTLLCTWLTLRGRQQLALPRETAMLIEQVYPLKPNEEQFEPVYQAALRAAAEKARLDEDRDVHNAAQRLIAKPAYEGLMTARNEELEEDDPRAGRAFRALTRQGEPSVSLICLYDTPQGIALEPDGGGAPLDISKRPDVNLARELLRRAVSVQRRDVVNHIVSRDNRTSEWKKSAAVRDHFPILFDVNWEYHPGGADFTLKLSRELGLQVIKNSKEAQ
ncbi:MAG: CRISPR-associated helicase Cas3' [Chloroflexota bacterium]